MTQAASRQPGIGMVFSAFRPHVPQVALVPDRKKVKSLGLTLSDVFQTLQTYLGSYYVNQFNLYGRTWRVFVAAESEYRRSPENLEHLYIRSAQNRMIPLSTIVNSLDTTGPDNIMRYNMYRAAELQAQAAPGFSSGQVITALDDAAKVLPVGAGFEWTGTAFAFILGVFPMVIASGPDAGSRHSLGTAVFFGMLAATVVGVFLIPALYVLVERLKEKLMRRQPMLRADLVKEAEVEA